VEREIATKSKKQLLMNFFIGRIFLLKGTPDRIDKANQELLQDGVYGT